MDIWGKVSCQFGNPTGILGKVAGFIMSHRGSNLERIDWAIELLKLKSDDRVLEIGFGPGIAIEKMETIASNGLVYGLDHSTLMYRQASSRNRKAIAAGTIRLFLGSVADIPKFRVSIRQGARHQLISVLGRTCRPAAATEKEHQKNRNPRTRSPTEEPEGYR